MLIAFPLIYSYASAAITAADCPDPAENPALRLDHLEAHLLEFREIRADAILEHEAVEPAIVGLAHRGVDADLGGDAADDQLRMPRCLRIASRSVA